MPSAQAASVTKPGRDPKSFPVSILLTCLVGLGPLSTDMYLPSLPAMTAAFSATESQVQLTLSGFMAGFAISQLIYGPLSDRFGRKNLVLIGLFIFAAASFLCAFAPTIEALIAGRFLQALGACCGPVLGRAIVRDTREGPEAARMLGYMATAMGVLPLIAPTLGGFLQIWFGWQSNFVAMGAMGVAILTGAALLLTETNRFKNPEATKMGPMLANYRAIANVADFRAYALVITAGYTSIFCFISGSSFVLITLLGVPTEWFGLCFGAIVSGFMIGSLTGARLTKRVRPERLVIIGQLIATGAAVTGAVLALVGIETVAAVVAPMTIGMVGIGLLMPSAFSGALQPFPKMAGAASSLMGFVQMATAAVIGAGVGAFSDGTTRPMMVTIGVATVVGLVGYLALKPRPAIKAK